MVVESRLSDGDDARLIKKVSNRGNTVACLMGMKADGGEYIIVMTGSIDRSETAVSVTTNYDECLNSSLTCQIESGVRSSGGALVIDMAMGVDPARL
tara:strand:+ start:253 stop:543 length:291 start_codon:yes stop_codon:yes gene_type:complete